MKLDFKFSNLCGSAYKKGNLLFTPDGNSVLSPVGNRVSLFDLVNNKAETFPFEARKNIIYMALSPNSQLLLTIDEDGRALLVNFKRRVVIHRFNFKGQARVAEFSPDGTFIAVGVGKIVELWKTPKLNREFAPFVLHKKYSGHFDDITHISWSNDSKYFLTSSKDMTAKLYSSIPIEGFVNATFAGHKDSIMGSWFGADMKTIYTVSKDGAVAVRKFNFVESREEVEFGTYPKNERTGELLATQWSTIKHFYFNQGFAKVKCAYFNLNTQLLLTGFSNGIFALHQMPDFSELQTLSISKNKLTAASINPSGEWIALASSTLGQLLVWEWQSESYVLKQQGHINDMSCVSYSADGQYLATGGDDGKVKVWTASNGFCFVTFSNHTAGITATQFTKKNQVVVTSSLDGTVRAFDLVRYRNFRTFLSPTPVQFSCLAVDPSGDIVAAGCQDSFDIYVWSMQTGKLLDVLSGHEGPVVSLEFRPDGVQLASASWDKSVRLWDVFDRSKTVEKLSHSFECLAVTYRPDSKQLSTSTLDGQIHFWNVSNASQIGSIEGRRDIAGGRRQEDMKTAANSAFGKSFNSLCYSADGTVILGSGNSVNVCLYDVDTKVLLKKFKISSNFSYDGMHEMLNSKYMTDAGPIQSFDSDHDASDLEDRLDNSLPGAKTGDLSKRTKMQVIRARGIRFSPSGQQFAVASNLGLVLYSLDNNNLNFDPFDLDLDISPSSIKEMVKKSEFLRALVSSIRLGEHSTINLVYQSIPIDQIRLMVTQIPPKYLVRFLEFICIVFEKNHQLELDLFWINSILVNHGKYFETNTINTRPILRHVRKLVTQTRTSLGKLCDDNIFEIIRLSNSSIQRPEETLKF
ncbi:Periodic tryptophan protein 2-like protein [Smittium mucronatum]|uniref:Periodic tryptophan protein 2-like protein n=1 Tax=Smittium mucronatum TaxID=133383 RepID=A0A1R0GVB0_9FUNG|nr:Periodic tryptophan protein 2-like protein [Smittium mucronatum]